MRQDGRLRRPETHSNGNFEEFAESVHCQAKKSQTVWEYLANRLNRLLLRRIDQLLGCEEYISQLTLEDCLAMNGFEQKKEKSREK